MTARLVCALGVLALAPAARPIDIGTLKPEGYVSDFARVVDAQSRQDIEAYCARVEKLTGVQMAFVTIPTLGIEPIEDFANDLYRRWGIGQKGKDEGLLLLLAVRDRRSRLEVGLGLEPHITDGATGSLLRRMRPDLQQNRYGDALFTAAIDLGRRISQAKGVQIPEETSVRRRPPPPPSPAAELPWPLLLGGMFLLFWIMSMGSRRRRYYYGNRGFLPGMILGSMLGGRSSWGGRGGGGFGGYDSGDSFGGFGGGDSGGGGASSNW
jgi:uncharacterized protein